MRSHFRKHTVVPKNNNLSGALQLYGLKTPAFVYDERILLNDFKSIWERLDATPCSLLYALKACSVRGILDLISKRVSGFACSSLFESRLAREIISDGGSIHFTSPGLRPDDFYALNEVCDYISFNSLTQWTSFKNRALGKVQCGLRVNPQLSFIDDQRYDPCRKHSKLGVPLEELVRVQKENGSIIDGVQGLHIHSNCDSTNAVDLIETITHIEKWLHPLLDSIEWINLGGGYLLGDADNHDDLSRRLEQLSTRYKVRIFMEPGSAIVRRSGSIVSTVLDIFTSDDKEVVILDTSINHMPEVFEYQFEPEVAEHIDNGRYRYILAGASCLSGDIFGQYSFNEPLKIGSRITFKEVGSYSLVKAHMFNGISLPSVYRYTSDGRLEMERQFSYEDFKSIWSESTDETIRKRTKTADSQRPSRLTRVS